MLPARGEAFANQASLMTLALQRLQQARERYALVSERKQQGKPR